MKKYLIALLIIILLISSVSLADSSLTDIGEHWAKEYIQSLIDKGIINGYPDGTFKPEGTLTGEQFIKMLVKSLDDTVENSTTGSWSQTYINYMSDRSLLQGLRLTNYTKTISRGDMAVLAANILKFKIYIETISTDVIENKLSEFEDYSSFTEDIKEAIYIANKYGIITGYPDGRFLPNGELTRAEGSVVISRIINALQENDNDEGSNNEETELTLEEILSSEEYKSYFNSENLVFNEDGTITVLKTRMSNTHTISLEQSKILTDLLVKIMPIVQETDRIKIGVGDTEGSRHDCYYFSIYRYPSETNKYLAYEYYLKPWDSVENVEYEGFQTLVTTWTLDYNVLKSENQYIDENGNESRIMDMPRLAYLKAVYNVVFPQAKGLYEKYIKDIMNHVINNDYFEVDGVKFYRDNGILGYRYILQE